MQIGWLSLAAAAWVSLASGQAGAIVPPIDRTAVQNMASHVVQQEDQATVQGNQEALNAVFLKNSASARNAYEKALSRMAYLKDWAFARKIQLDEVTVHVRVDRVHWVNSTEVRITGADQAEYDYHHLEGSSKPVSFGLGVYHRYTFKEVNGHWFIQSDSFIDPLNQDTRLKGAAVPAVIQVKPEHRRKAPSNSGAARAIRFAETYCGAAPGCGNAYRYHPDYADFNGHGGDCSNFISQVLHAGGFPETKRWAWDSESEGTHAWINATRLAQYLQKSSRADLYAVGTLPAIIHPWDDGVSPLSRIRPGDLIGYFETSRVVHFAIVVGFDPDGYPVVVSHSADRYRVPWDLGWDRTTRYLLFHVYYPTPSGGGGDTKDHASPSSTTSAVRTR